MLETLDLSPINVGGEITMQGSVLNSCPNLKTIILPFKTAPFISSGYAFGSKESSYTGRNTYNTGENMLYVPEGATGYDTGAWLDPLQNPEACGFTISYTL